MYLSCTTTIYFYHRFQIGFFSALRRYIYLCERYGLQETLGTQTCRLEVHCEIMSLRGKWFVSMSNIVVCYVDLIQYNGPRSHYISPTELLITLSPSHYTLSSSHYTLSPSHYTLSPSHYTLSPSHYTLSPSHYTLSPSHYTLSPSHYTLSPSHYTLSPSHYTLSPSHYTSDHNVLN